MVTYIMFTLDLECGIFKFVLIIYITILLNNLKGQYLLIELKVKILIDVLHDHDIYPISNQFW